MSNLNRKLIGHLCTLQSSERFIARFHFVAKFIIQFISKSKAHSICVLSVVIHKCYTVLFFYVCANINKDLSRQKATAFEMSAFHSIFWWYLSLLTCLMKPDFPVFHHINQNTSYCKPFWSLHILVTVLIQVCLVCRWNTRAADFSYKKW